MVRYYGPYDGFGNAAQVGMGFVFGIIMILYILLMAASVAVYVLQSIGLYSIAKRRGIHKPWLAWLPIGNMWILGSISDQYRYVVKGQVRNRRKVLMGLTIALLGLSVVMVAAEVLLAMGGAAGSGFFAMGLLAVIFIVAFFVLTVVGVVFQYICCYDLFRSCQKDNAVVYLVLSILVSIALPVILFLCRKDDQGMPPRRKASEAPAEEDPEMVVDADFAEEITEPEIVEEVTEEVVESDFADEIVEE